MGLPGVTTDLSGFGAYVQRHVPDHEQQGIVRAEPPGPQLRADDATPWSSTCSSSCR